ncbi:MAG: TylF/MycF/NovP-related O-methyltransferase [Paracoccaceae bacterium]
MFYGRMANGGRERLKAALETLNEVCGPLFAADNLIGLQRSAGFREDAKFVEAIKNNARTEQDRSLAWRLHTLCWAAQNVMHLPGDFVECGVWKGYSFGVATEYVGFGDTDKTLYLYDTYEGIPEAYNSENRNNSVYENENREDPDYIFNIVKNRFASFDNVRVVRGIVPDSFAEACPDQISLLHLDMNSAASEIAALEHLFDRVVPGGVILFDDYGWTGYKAQRLAEDVFMAERGHSILELPTGQGMLLKH